MDKRKRKSFRERQEVYAKIRHRIKNTIIITAFVFVHLYGETIMDAMLK